MTTLSTIAVKVRRLSQWFYEFDLPGVVRTASALPESVRHIHDTRRKMLCTAIKDHFGDRIPVIFALIDETADFGAGAREAGSAPLALCPSPRALEHILLAVGFVRVERIARPPNGYEQLVRGTRVVFAAYKKSKNGCSEHV